MQVEIVNDRDCAAWEKHWKTIGKSSEKVRMTNARFGWYNTGIRTTVPEYGERNDMITEALVKWAVAFVCGGVISLAAAYVKARFKREKAISDGVQCLLRAEIIACHERYDTEGRCPIYAKESLKRVYEAYHALGGNDIATSLYEQTLALPDREREAEA